MTTFTGINAILTDIEGTTTDIDFVHKTLFPYARERMVEFIHSHPDEPAVAEAASALGVAVDDLDAIAEGLIHWIDQDKKETALKSLQGLIWVQGYEQGDFTGHLYPDAYEGLKRWHDAGKQLNIFSSGSVKAQKLLYGYSDFGDLTPLFSGYFDTTSGAKREPVAYERIGAAIGRPASEILFLSDVVQELDAAAVTGMQTCLLVRGERPEGAERHCAVENFDQIELD
ncbi:acireductone synthase [Marinobacterium sediminicola]|uniref:Enolase-phosphatase E1 n=1 Tax=Marinobacterium sediminicola TaxID=518898 RepID=A0ABY1S343_9GAMM|nr:acireductone synthase [Marinobacterium sediminicola]ULG68863.1 acireductone synthase [Marinobacterium sediminicola]SMR77527.1 acireductone synthase [Marinobacterium sediminicola]